MNLSTRAHAALDAAGLAMDDREPAAVAALGWRKVRDAGAGQDILSELQGALAKAGLDFPEDPAPRAWTIRSVALTAEGALVALAGPAALRVPLSRKEARSLKVGDVVRVTVKAVRK